MFKNPLTTSLITTCMIEAKESTYLEKRKRQVKDLFHGLVKFAVLLR